MSAAIHSQKKKMNIEIFESAKYPGGRCRSFYDKKTDIEIDNGNHLVFSANKNFKYFCELIGSSKTLKVISPNFFFFDFKRNLEWNLDLSSGYSKFLTGKKKLIPNTTLFDYLSLLKFFLVSKNSSVFEIVGDSKIFKTFWEPLTLGVMNTAPHLASAKVLSNVLKETIFKGEEFCRIFQPKINWNESLIKPAVLKIKKNGGLINYGNLLKKINITNNNVSELFFMKKRIKVNDYDRVIFSIPPTNLSKLLDNSSLPNQYNTILNLHFKIKSKDISLFQKPIVGFINSVTQWIFIKSNHISVTVSNANDLNSIDTEQLTMNVWGEICKYTKKNITYENVQIVREKKATYVQSPNNINLVKKFNNIPENAIIAGDWTQYNLPCTIEASILSGKKAIETI